MTISERRTAFSAITFSRKTQLYFSLNASSNTNNYPEIFNMTPSSPLRTQTRGWRVWPKASSSSRYDLAPLLVNYGNTLHQGPGPGQEDGGDVAGGPGLQLRLAGDPQEVGPAVRGERVQAVQSGVCEVS